MEVLYKVLECLFLCVIRVDEADGRAGKDTGRGGVHLLHEWMK